MQWPDGYAVNYTYDNLNRMATAADSAITLASYGYDPLSRRTSLNYGNGTSVAYTYSNAGDLLTLAHNFTGSTNDVTFTNTYTNAHQLATEAVSNSAWQWQPASLVATPYAAANNLNQYPSVNSVAFGYDAKGNLTSDGVRTYAYDAENRLLTANGTGLAAVYAYDPLGRRSAKSLTGTAAPAWGSVNWGSFTWTAAAITSTYFVSDGSNEIAEYDGSGALAARTVPGPAIDEPIAREAFGATSFYHTNRQGSVIAMSDASGNLAEGPYTYDPYGDCYMGATTTPCGTSGQPYRFTGRRLDPETGLYYYRARMYGPGIGRFWQTDPVGYTADLNLYTYGGNDPTDKSDPSGRAFADDPGTAQVQIEAQVQLSQEHPSAATAIAITGVAAPVVAAGCAAGGCEVGGGSMAVRIITSGTIGAAVSADVSAAKGNSQSQVISDSGKGALTSMANTLGGPVLGPVAAGMTSAALDLASGKSGTEIAVNAVATALGAAAGNYAQKTGVAPALSSTARTLVAKPVSTSVSEGVKAVGSSNGCAPGKCK